MGPGFDCIGMAFKLYNNLWVEIINDAGVNLIIENKNSGFRLPLNENNLIYKSMKRFYAETGIDARIPPVKIIQDDRIPLTRGLGSSAACVVGGLLAANELSGVKMPKDDLCFLAAAIEGHPDNSAPAILGGVVIGALSEKKLDYIKLVPPDGLAFACLIPDFKLPTAKARKILPKNVPMTDAVFNVSRAALMAAALINGRFDLLGAATDDRLHQPYRLPLVPDMDKLFYFCKINGARGVFLSGAGPSIIALYDAGDAGFMERIETHLHKTRQKWKIVGLEPDNDGAVVKTEAYPS